MGWTQKQMIAELRDQAANNSLDPDYEKLVEAVANEVLRLAKHVDLLRDALLNHSEPLTGDEHMQFCGEAIDKTTPNAELCGARRASEPTPGSAAGDSEKGTCHAQTQAVPILWRRA